MTGPTFSPDGQWMWDGNSWIPAPPQSNTLSHTPSPINHQVIPSTTTHHTQPHHSPVEQNIHCVLLNKRWFPSIKLTLLFNDPQYGLQEEVSFSTLARTYTAKLANGLPIGKLPLQGLVVWSGAKGVITFPGGPSYAVLLDTGPLGVKALTVTDMSDGRTSKCWI